MAEQNLGALKVSLGLDSAQFNASVADINRKLRAVRTEFDAASDGTKEYGRSLDGLRSKSQSLTREMQLHQAKVQALKQKYEELARTKGEDNKATQNAIINYNKALAAMKRTEAQLARTNSAIENHEDNVERLGGTFARLKASMSNVGEKIGGIFKNITSTAGTATLTVAKFSSIIGGIGSAATPAVAGVMALGASAVSAGAGLAGFGIVATSVLGSVFEDTDKLAQAQEKLDQATNAEERKKAMEEIQQIYSGMNSSQRKAVEELQKFKTFFGEFTQQFQKPIFAAFTNSLKIAQTALTLAKPAIDSVSKSVLTISQNILTGLGSSEVKGIFTWFGQTAGASLMNFAKIAGNALLGVMNLIKAFNPLSKGMENGLVSLTQKFRAWSEGLSQSNGFQKFIEYARVNGPLMINIFKNIMVVLGAVVAAIAPLASQVTHFILVMVNKLTEWVTHLHATKSQVDTFKTNVVQAFQKIRDFVQPAISAVASFVGAKIKQIKKFWDSDGEQFKQACVNAFKVIQKIVQFVMPFILGIIKSVWGNIKGVINGTLNVIMGAIRVFSGLFTGDFKKMWQGVVQIFKGSIQTAWNLVNLLFVGRILKGIGGFVKGFVALLKGGWKSAISGMKGFVSDGYKQFKAFVKNGKDKFDELIKAGKELPKKLGDGIGSMAKAVGSGVKKLANSLATGLGAGINGVIGGVNWVLHKVGVSEKDDIPKWKVPHYAKGTEGHPGGLAVLGDGKKHELWVAPNGEMGLSPNRDTLMNLPKGTRVFSGEQTQELLKGRIPAYKKGNVKDLLEKVGSGAKKVVSSAKDKVVEGAGVVKDTALDIWSYVGKPAELMKKVFAKFVPKLPSIGGAMDLLANGLLKKLKDKSVDFIKKKLESFGGDGAGFGNGAAFKGKGAAVARAAITQALQMLGKPMSLLGPLMSIAKHESGFNPNAINLWDINARRGDPSIGLFQIIGSTFKRWMYPGHGNRRNPLDSALAAIRYMDGRYGGVMNHPGIKSMMRGGGYKPYAQGGLVNQPRMGLVGEAGKEMIIPLENFRSRAIQLWMQTGKILGMFDLPKSSQGIQRPSSSTTSTPQQTNVTNTYYINVDYSGTGSKEDVKEFVKMVKEEIDRQDKQLLRSQGVY